VPIAQNYEPQPFMPNLLEEDKLIHKGILSPNNETYLYTESLRNFTRFEVKQIQKEGNKWSKPQKAFFNTKYDEHGMSFSSNGNYLYFSSTRPTNIEGIPNTWHLWMSEKINTQWTKPKFIDIPNMRDKLLSHPTITDSGELYFHASNLDYSEMNIYSSVKKDGKFSNAALVKFDEEINRQKCTPFVAPNGDYLIFAEIQNDLILKISFKENEENWSTSREFSQKINTSGLGNPFVTKNEEFLFFTRKDSIIKVENEIWNVYRVKIKEELKN